MILFHDKGDLDLDKLKSLCGDELGLCHFEKIALLKLIDDGNIFAELELNQVISTQLKMPSQLFNSFFNVSPNNIFIDKNKFIQGN